MAKDHDKPFWKTALKLALGAIAVIVFFGVGLYYTAKYNTYAPPDVPAVPDWGISKDHPIPSQR
ncbi:MAG: hypothetical protein BWK72_17560 [Rhodoferax ferrireducens]|uniref:Uncharacterized protein n=1 Tax=Rhodoferax ferrireducens TaxID=192843 RepID=A0A1W9KQG0_9BURK|nr:MAG: hypothetical protein BWK72_17560 [Rhodoferax ferrireducens]